ncbi:hypothetical protein [Mucilaginibacter paludis]|uniref:RiboL-PSP-HEPN domain-containing protein n=1 Tax=Mucilaginibacter paludis DSM 18603 TaxID=714943 RepID=H1YBY7_9SPHI|nr:hypothetical protein [Mucilaginibacter paludis]EHQ27065.1 hypothetical protein Mucpa_2957 [Mucilaginibacter paludis DSM 18603]
MSKHTDFIRSPITDVLKDVVAANAAIGNGIETYPLTEYIMQSVFLKMTGFQEQKMKCISWELATNDYEHRYNRYTKKPLGECSTYDEKKIVYKDLIGLLKKNNPDFNLNTAINRVEIRRNTFTAIRELFLNSNLSSWAESSFLELSSGVLFTHEQFATENDLLVNILQDKYSLLYDHRNRCAHNTQSYQENLPTLATILSKNYKDDNYFVRFTLLILIDNIFRALYDKYLAIMEEG